MKKIFNKRENKGITTMTVVISVIILIILASIGINLSVSENGIIKKSKKIVNGMNYSSQLQANETNRIVTGLEDEGGKYLRTTLLVTPESASKVKEINLKIAVSNKDKVTAKTSNKYQYYVSTSEDKLQGGQWLDYKLGTPFTIKNITGKRYVFVKQLTDTYGVVTITKGTTVTIDGVQYQRFGEYVFDNNAPTNTAPQIILASTKTIVIENKQTDDEGQLKTVVYEIKKTTDPDDGWKGQDSGRFENLDENTEYQVRTVSTDEAGNTSESVVVTVRTTGIPGPESIKSAQNPAGWTNTDRELTISTTVKGYKLETSKDGKNWIKTENQKTYNYGDKVYARLTDGTNFGEQFVFEELQIDKQAPTDTAPTATSTTRSVTVTCTQKDEGSGEDKTKSASGIDTIKTQYRLVTDTTGKIALKDWQNSNVFEGLTHNTNYYVQTKVTDNAGNTTTSAVATAKTGTVPSGTTSGVITLTADHSSWTNTDVIVTATTNQTGYTIQMSTDGKTFKDGNKVTLTQNGTVYARLRDSSNNYGASASISISIIDKVAPTKPTYKAFYDDGKTTYTSGTWTNKHVKTDISSIDANSGINRIEYSFDKNSWTKFQFGLSSGLHQNGTTYTGTESWGLKNRNDTVYFRAIDNAGNISEVFDSFNIRYDISTPTTTAPTATTKTNSITVTNKQTDALSGISSIQYQIKKNSDTTWGSLQSSATFTGLTQNTKYDVRTHAVDKAGNASDSAVTTVTTSTIPTPTKGSNLTFTPTPSAWTNGNVSVKVATTVTGYTLQTSTDGKSWGITNPLTYSANGTAYARLWDGNNASAVATTNITNIDKLAPTNTAPTIATTTNKITSTLKQVDQNAANGSGKSDLNASKTQYRLVTDTKGTTAVTGKDWQSSNVFSGLTQNTTYYVQTKVTDNAGNTTTSAVATAKTTIVPSGTTSGVITLTPDHNTWTNTDVKVTATTNQTGFVIQMSTDGKTFKEGNIVTLTQNGTVYARLRDASNNYGAAASKSISIIDKIAPTNIAPTATATSSSITVTNKQTDVNSRIKTVQYQIKKTSDSTWSSLTSTATFENLLTDTSYDVRTYATDNANNSSYSLVYTISTDSAVWAKSYDTDNDGVGDLLYLSNNKSDTYSTGTVVKDYGDANLKSGYPDWSNDTSFTRVVIGNKIVPKSTFGWFYNQKKLTEINNLKFLDTSKVTNMWYMFYNCRALTSLDLSNFDTSKVTNMKSMFTGCGALTSLDVSKFDTSKVTDMYNMFSNCIELTTLDVSNFNTSNVINMGGMFSFCSALTSLDLSNFDTSNVTDMGSMFYVCGKLTTLDVSKFDTSKVTNMESMFTGCGALTSLDVSKFDTSKVTTMNYMFTGCSALTSLDVSNFSTSNVINMRSMFGNCSKLTSLDLSNFDTSNVTDMGSMFYGCGKLTTLDVSKFDTSKVTNMGYMFYYCSAVTSLDVSKFDTSKVTNMGYMFSNCIELTSLDLSNFDTSNVTNMREMFYECFKLTTLDVSKFDTSKVTNMGYMFDSCVKLTTLDVSKFDTSKVTNMCFMFYTCRSLTSLDLSNFDTSNVTSMEGMFLFCSALTSLDVSNFSTSNVIDMRNMFSDCFKLTTLDVSKFDTSKVTNMEAIFRGCSALTTLDVSKFDTSKVTNMEEMFYDCGKLITLDLSNFDTSKVTNMGYMFKDCSNLQKIIVSNDNTYNFDVSNVTNSSQMFDGCSKLVGEQGTKYDSNHTDKLYAHIDGGTSNPGYFSKK